MTATPITDRLTLYRDARTARIASFADDVRRGLSATPKTLASKYFYDDLGSALFEAICRLPEYYLTRVETKILSANAGEILGELEGPVDLIELGSGSAVKTRILIEEALRVQKRLHYRPVDISADALLQSSKALIEAHERLVVTAFASDYMSILSSPNLRGSERSLVLFLGSNVGNYEPAAAVALLAALARALRPGDGLLLGADLKKSPRVLEEAYDDATGVTAAFNKNMLGRINRELGGHFDLHAFRHVVRYDERWGRVDSFLAASEAMRVAVDALKETYEFAPGETIHTESSYKFSQEDIDALARRSGFALTRSWTDEERQYDVSLLTVT